MFSAVAVLFVQPGYLTQVMQTLSSSMTFGAWIFVPLSSSIVPVVWASSMRVRS